MTAERLLIALALVNLAVLLLAALAHVLTALVGA